MSGSGFFDPGTATSDVTGVTMVDKVKRVVLNQVVVPSGDITVVSDTEIDISSLPSTTVAATYAVEVATADGTGINAAGSHYTYEAPVVVTKAPTPAAGPLGTGPKITVHGTGFVPNQMTVTWGTTVIPASTETSPTSPGVVCSKTECRFTAPAQSTPGTVTYTIGDLIGTVPNSSAAQSYTFDAAPVIDPGGVSPTSGPSTGHTGIDIFGANFVPGTVVKFGTKRITPDIGDGGTFMLITSPGETYVDSPTPTVTITTPGGSTSFIFTYTT